VPAKNAELPGNTGEIAFPKSRGARDRAGGGHRNWPAEALIRQDKKREQQEETIMRKLVTILLTAGGLALAAGATATSALSQVRLDLNFGAPYYGYGPYYYYSPYGYYGHPYYYRHHYYRHW
jgi:hypothetical protein